MLACPVLSHKLLSSTVTIIVLQETQYSAIVKMPSAELQRICRDLSQIGDSGNWIMFLAFSANILT